MAEISEGDLTAKEGLLLWAQKKVAEGSGGKGEVKAFDASQVLVRRALPLTPTLTLDPNPNPNPNPHPDPNPNPSPNPRQVAESVSGRVEVKNFHNSWSNGLAFCALINAYNPELLDFSSLDAKNKLDNLKLAFSLAETQMGIPCFLDADDMISVRPDEKSVMTYASLPSASVGSGQ